MSTLIFFATNLQVSSDSSKQQLKNIEGFLSECSADEIQYKATVPLQCIPAETMKATEQAEINKVDRFEMQQRVSQKAQMAKKLGTMVTNLQTFQKEFGELNKEQMKTLTEKVQKGQAEYNFWANPSESTKRFNSEEKIERKKQESKADLDTNTNNLAMAKYYFKFSSYSMKQLVETYTILQKEVEGVADKFEQGIPGAPKT